MVTLATLPNILQDVLRCVPNLGNPNLLKPTFKDYDVGLVTTHLTSHLHARINHKHYTTQIYSTGL